jgi:hypothetical protein
MPPAKMATKRDAELSRFLRTKDKLKHIFEAKKSDTMSRSQESSLCGFKDLAFSYRVYILDDLLAEPQEICHDWMRGLLYISQRYLQGNSFAPIESSHEISIFDISVGDVVGTIDLSPYAAPHGMELDQECSYLYANVSDGAVWIDTETGTMTSYAPMSSQAAPVRSSSNDFIAEVDLRNGRFRQRVDVPESETPTDGRFVAFSAPAIRFASRATRNGLPVVNVDDDVIIQAIKAKFNVQTLYVTSRNIMLV